MFAKESYRKNWTDNYNNTCSGYHIKLDVTVKLRETFPNGNPIGVRNMVHLVFDIIPILSCKA